MTVVVEIEGEVVNYGENLAVTFYSVPEKDAEYIEMHVHEWKVVFRIMNRGHNWVKVAFRKDMGLGELAND